MRRRRRKKLQPQDAMRDLFLQDDIKAERARIVAQRAEEHGNPIGDMLAALRRVREERNPAREAEQPERAPLPERRTI